MTSRIDLQDHYCIRGLRRYNLGEGFGKWVLNFYQEMVARKLHRYFSYDTRSKAIASIASKKLEVITEKGEEADIAKSDEELLENRMMANSYIIRCLDPETIQYLEESENSAENGFLWLKLIEQRQSNHNHTLREVHQQ